MHKVDGETLPTQPEQQTVGKELFSCGGDVDGENDHVHTEGRIPLADVDAWWKYVVGHSQHDVGPACPLRVFARVAGNEQANNHKKAGDDLAGPWVVVNNVVESGGVRQVTQEHTVDGLHLESFYSAN